MFIVTATQSFLVAAFIGRSWLCRLLGSERADRVVGELFCDLTGIARNTKGETIKIMDDRLMCAFASADDAVAVAAVMHQLTRSRTQLTWDDSRWVGLDIRIGTGTVLRDDNRLTGEAVDWALNLKTGIEPHRTLVSETTLKYLSRERKELTRFAGSWPAGDRQGVQGVYEFIGMEDNITLALEHPPEPPKRALLDIVHGPVIITMGIARQAVTIGRSAENDLFLNYPRVSRKHARIEIRQDKFMLVDTSYNGTYVKIGDLDSIRVKHEEIPLIGKGIICPGREASSSSPGAIHFTLR